MARIQVQRVIDAPTDVVWTELSDIASHVEWMADAAAIRFTGDRHRGVGTTFDCVTKVGPLRTVDRDDGDAAPAKGPDDPETVLVQAYDDTRRPPGLPRILHGSRAGGRRIAGGPGARSCHEHGRVTFSMT